MAGSLYLVSPAPRDRASRHSPCISDTGLKGCPEWLESTLKRPHLSTTTFRRRRAESRNGGRASIMQQSEIQPNDRALFFKELRTIVPFGRTFIYQLIKEGDFPPPVKVGKRSAWSEVQVRAWWANQLANQATRSRPANDQQVKQHR